MTASDPFGPGLDPGSVPPGIPPEGIATDIYPPPPPYHDKKQKIKEKKKMKIHVETLSEARLTAKLFDMTYRKVEGGYLVMDYAEAKIWDNQK